jgi:hypothetical protein
VGVGWGGSRGAGACCGPAWEGRGLPIALGVAWLWVPVSPEPGRSGWGSGRVGQGSSWSNLGREQLG